MKNVGNSSDGRSQGVPKISGHPCIGRMGALRGHLCDSTAFLFCILPSYSGMKLADFLFYAVAVLLAHHLKLYKPAY